MFTIDKENNEISPLKKCSFSSLGFKERQHLQEWIAKRPECLGEDLLIIQKEFAGFSDTNERLDLLALDKNGSLVVIENKLDDTGKDVTWQALKYTSYCSSLTTEQIIKIYQSYLGKEQNAEERIAEFLDEEDFDSITLNKGFSQRIFIIAANFRKEVTSTVIWLSNFKVKIKCFKVTPYSMDDDSLFLNVEQIIPTKDAEEYTIGLADKAQDEIAGGAVNKERHKKRREFWETLLPKINEKSPLFQNRKTTRDYWLGVKSHHNLAWYQFVITNTNCRAEVRIAGGTKEANKAVFDALFKQKEEIDASFGGAIEWMRLNEYLSCIIRVTDSGNIKDKNQWPDMMDFMVDAMVRLEKAFEGPLKALSNKP